MRYISYILIIIKFVLVNLLYNYIICNHGYLPISITFVFEYRHYIIEV